MTISLKFNTFVPLKYFNSLILASTITEKKKKKGPKNSVIMLGSLGAVWYMCLKTENCCLKTFVEIRVGEKVYENAWNVV